MGRLLITIFGELLGLVLLVGGADQVGDLVLLQQLDVVVHGPVLEIWRNIKYEEVTLVNLSKYSLYKSYN